MEMITKTYDWLTNQSFFPSRENILFTKNRLLKKKKKITDSCCKQVMKSHDYTFLDGLRIVHSVFDLV